MRLNVLSFQKMITLPLMMIAMHSSISFANGIRQIDQPEPPEARYIAEIELHSVEEIRAVLEKADALASEQDEYLSFQPIALVLHGPEVEIFVKDNYKKHKSIVDLAAKLDAFKIVDIKICENWMGKNGVTKQQLPPFVETVPFGVVEKARLKDTGYQAF